MKKLIPIILCACLFGCKDKPKDLHYRTGTTIFTSKKFPYKVGDTIPNNWIDVNYSKAVSYYIEGGEFVQTKSGKVVVKKLPAVWVDVTRSKPIDTVYAKVGTWYRLNPNKK